MTNLHPPAELFSAIAKGVHGDPFAVLGPRAVDGGVVIRDFVPDADALAMIDRETGEPLGHGQSGNGRHGRPFSARVTLPPLATVCFRVEETG